MRSIHVHFALLLIATLPLAQLGCGSDDGDALGIAPDCNPLGGGACVLPMPASIYQRSDSTSPTGVRLDFGATTLPRSIDKVQIAPDQFNKRDGFSANAPILATFPGGVDSAGLSDIAHPTSAQTANTMLVDMETGKRVLHFAEVDVATAATPDKQALIIWPLERLRGGKRYAVGLRRALKTRAGAPLPISPGFQALLDGTVTGNARLERARPGYPAVFSALETAGMAKADLALAWDFTVASDASIQSDLVTARDLAVAAMGPADSPTGPFTFRVVPGGEPEFDPLVTERIVLGNFDAPNLLTSSGTSGVMMRDAAGKPMVSGIYKAPFSAVIPKCAAAQKPVPVVIYGHGLMGSGKEVLGGYPRKAAQHVCAIFIATDWRGMSEIDLPAVALTLNDLNQMPTVMDKLVQGIVNFIALEQIARGPMARSADFMDAGTPLIDPTRVYYYGISQGGIFGATFMAHDPVVKRGVLGVNGVNYSLLIQRSSDWPRYGSILNGAYSDLLDDQVLMYLLQMGWDPVDPVSSIAGIVGAAAQPLSGTPSKQILMQVAIGDSQVPVAGAELAARISGIPVLGPALFDVPGVETKPGPLPSALTMWDLHRTPVPPTTNTSLDDNGAHGAVRKLQTSNDQIKHFFQTGDIIQTCGGATPVACDCAQVGVCGAEL